MKTMQGPAVQRSMGLHAILAIGIVRFGASVAPAEADPKADVLRFENPMSAVINARRWDETQEQWMERADQESPLFFDAVHRFLLLQFAGCAEAIREKMQAGFAIESAALAMEWDKQEWLRVKGYHHRGYRLEDKPVDAWHAKVWALRRPWSRDADTGPTWNAYLNGAGYWEEGGARSGARDRFPASLGECRLSQQEPSGSIDVTRVLVSPDHGADLGTRLRALEANGFLIEKAELCGPHHGGWGLSTGNARMWIRDPELVVTFRPASPQSISLPPPVGLAVLAQRLRGTVEGGHPTTVIPDDIADLARQARERRPDMPDWMRARVRQVRRLRTITHERDDLGFTMPDHLESGDADRYTSVVNELLRCPPGWFRGHAHLDFMMPMLLYRQMLPDVVDYHLCRYFEARWLPPYSETELRHRVGYHGGMATLNHQGQFRSEALLAGELLGMRDLERMAQRNLSLLNRQMIFSEGTIQERGDSFYLGITLGTLQVAAKHSRDPLMRLKTGLAVEKILFESNSTYHPGLKRRVSRISRRYRLHDLLLAQSVPRAVLHMLSRKGALIESDKLYVHGDRKLAARLAAGEDLSPEETEAAKGIPTLNFHCCAPVRIALLAPWGADWEANVTDEKPLPFLSVSTDYVRGHMQEPVYNVTYLGRSYGLASVTCDIGSEWPVLGVWRRTRRDVEKLDDLGVLFPWPYMNGKAVSMYNQQEPVGVKWNAPNATLQHRNRLVHVVRPPERVFAADFCRDGVRSFSSRVSIFTYGQGKSRSVWINGERIDRFPATAKANDVITLDEGESYVGLIPLPATDLGRDEQVAIDYAWPRLNLDSYVVNTTSPLPNEDATWKALQDATAGWVIELGDRGEHGSFRAFQRHMQRAQLSARWSPEQRVLDVTYAGGGDTLQLGCSTQHYRETPDERYIRPERMLTEQRVNGQWPWPDKGIDLDCPLGQLGKAETLTKGGATLTTRAGQMALLRTEPISNTYEAVNPFTDPQPLELTTPEGVSVRSEGPMSIARVTVQPATNRLWIDYCLPPEGGDPGVLLLQEAARRGEDAGSGFEVAMSRIMRSFPDAREARRVSARTLLVAGMGEQPIVMLNGDRLSAPFDAVREGGTTWLRIPIVAEPGNQ